MLLKENLVGSDGSIIYCANQTAVQAGVIQACSFTGGDIMTGKRTRIQSNEAC